MPPAMIAALDRVGVRVQLPQPPEPVAPWNPPFDENGNPEF